ncbi:ABC transporter protein [Mycena kentingensis (nom. inval.)]|nr:ABC transporter protein [Mycena kentingensis (nom. inval.)]
MFLLQLALALVFLGTILAHPIHDETGALNPRGALDGLFGDDDISPLTVDAPQENPDTNEPQVVPRPPRIPLTTKDAYGLADILPTKTGKHAKAASTNSPSHTATTLLATPNLASPSETTSPSGSSYTISVLGGVSPTSTLAPVQDASQTSSTAQWKIVGAAMVGIVLVAGVLFSAVYFESVWRCCLAIVGKKRRSSDGEEIVPDWARGDWEYKIASEDGHRYPTMASLEEFAKEKMSPSTPDPHSLVPGRPPSLYLPTLEPHPLEALFRRPSASNHHNAGLKTPEIARAC